MKRKKRKIRLWSAVWSADFHFCRHSYKKFIMGAVSQTGAKQVKVQVISNVNHSLCKPFRILITN